MRKNRPDRPSLELDDYSGGGEALRPEDRRRDPPRGVVRRGRCRRPREPRHLHLDGLRGRGHLELFGFRHGAARWNEKIRIDPEKLPPRASKDEPHCRWRISSTDARVDYASEPGEFVKAHGLQRETDAEIVNHEAGKYSRRRSG